MWPRPAQLAREDGEAVAASMAGASPNLLRPLSFRAARLLPGRPPDAAKQHRVQVQCAVVGGRTGAALERCEVLIPLLPDGVARQARRVRGGRERQHRRQRLFDGERRGVRRLRGFQRRRGAAVEPLCGGNQFVDGLRFGSRRKTLQHRRRGYAKAAKRIGAWLVLAHQGACKALDSGILPAVATPYHRRRVSNLTIRSLDDTLRSDVARMRGCKRGQPVLHQLRVHRLCSRQDRRADLRPSSRTQSGHIAHHQQCETAATTFSGPVQTAPRILRISAPADMSLNVGICTPLRSRAGGD